MKNHEKEISFNMWDNVFVVPSKDENTIDIHLSFSRLIDAGKGRRFYEIITANGCHLTFYYKLTYPGEIRYGISFPLDFGGEGVAYVNSVKEDIEKVQDYLESYAPKRLIVEKSDGEVIGEPMMVTIGIANVGALPLE